MPTYAEIQAQIAQLHIQAEAARFSEISAAKTRIAEIMKDHGVTLADLGGVAKAKVAKPGQTVPAKYRDPSSGAEWTGRGRAPLWLAGRDKEQFLIK